MAFDCLQQRKPLFSDLFKRPEQRTTAAAGLETPSWISTSGSGSGSGSSWSQSLLSYDSSSSGLSTPLYSDLGSSESDDGDFIAELTRQMAECMLQEEDEESTDRKCLREDGQTNIQVKNSSKINTDIRVTNSSAVGTADRMAPFQVYELKKQPPVSKRDRRRRAKAAESAQFPKKAPPKKTEQRQLIQYAGRDWGINGSGMQAVFLGKAGSGPGHRTGFTGTGFFMPRVAGDPAELRKKSGCPMVLIPTRVLQVLEGHFTRVQDFTGEHTSPNGMCPPDASECCGAVEDGQSHEVGGEMKISGNNYNSDGEGGGSDMMQLPKEWTY